MLPSRALAGQVVAFFEDTYWRAEEARVEMLRRQLVAERQAGEPEAAAKAAAHTADRGTLNGLVSNNRLRVQIHHLGRKERT